MFIDPWGRQITYLRVSVTDRCNFRCVYCMPPEGVAKQSHQSILRYEEIAEVVRVAAEHGVREVRLTGGEPLVRNDLNVLVKLLAEIPGIEDISITTNGYLLDRYAKVLAEAGLKRVNISLDTLDPKKFEKITRGGNFEQMWKGLEAAEAAGLSPIKINAVMMRGVNDDDLIPLASLTLTRDWHVRFIELMPIQNQASWGAGFPNPSDAFLSIQDALEILSPLNPVPHQKTIGDGPAQEFVLQGAKGKIGFISPLSEQEFCQRCNRLRLTADGNLRPCLMSDIEVPILAALRSEEPILPLLEKSVQLKPMGHELTQNHAPSGRCMMQIGG